MKDNKELENSFKNQNFVNRKNDEELVFKEYIIKGNKNQLFDFKISQSQKFISFHIKEESYSNKKYKKEITLEQFYNLNRIFRQFLSLEELFGNFFKNLKDSEIIISENNNSIKITLEIDFRGLKEEINFILSQDQTEIENLFYTLCDNIKKVENLKKINENIIKEFNEIKTIKNNQNKNILFTLLNLHNKKLNYILLSIMIFLFCLFIQIFIVNPIKNEINIIKKDIDNLKINNNKKLINRGIIRTDELFLIEGEIKKIYNKNVKKYELLFRASRDGYGSADFHKKCDGEINTITFVKTAGGRRFGGFTDLEWNKKNRYKFKGKDFTFSLDNEKIYNNEENINNNYYINPNDGPYFRGINGFKICDKSNLLSSSEDFSYNQYNYKSYNNYNSYNIYNEYNNNQNINNRLAESKNFYIKNYEVFKIYME